MSVLRDVFSSAILPDLTGETSSSALGHAGFVGKIAALEFFRRARAIPPGTFEGPGVRLPTRMLDVLDEKFEVVVAPLGDPAAWAVHETTRVVWEMLGASVTIERRREPDPRTYDPIMQVVDADKYLDLVWRPGVGRRRRRLMLTVTDLPCHLRDQRPVHGYAHMTRGIAIVSSAYMDKPRKQFLKIAIHEIVHMLGIPHCDDGDCVMNEIPLTGIDGVPYELCQFCVGKILNGSFEMGIGKAVR